MTVLLRRGMSGLVILALCAGGLLAPASSTGASRAHLTQSCSSGHGNVRDPANPLDLPNRPGLNPLNGARLFVEGPLKGLAAGAIAEQLHRNPASFGDPSWSRFNHYVSTRRHVDRGAAHRINLLRKIASQPETKWLTIYNRGGGPGAMYGSASDYVCRMHKTDRRAVAVMMTYLLNHAGDCRTSRETNKAAFRRRIDELASAVGNFPFVLYAEMDAIDTASCLSSGGLADRIELLRYEIDKLSSLPHGVIYVEGGVSDANSPSLAGRILNQIGVGKIRGFFVNETHYQWTSTEIGYANAVSRLTQGAHYVIDTRANGTGPLFNPDPVHQGVENLCNPSGRGLGPRPTTRTGYLLADAFAWISTPGRSSGSQCHTGDAGAGLWDTDVALHLAAHANGKLGPGHPSLPY